jgi:hypothetical protein
MFGLVVVCPITGKRYFLPVNIEPEIFFMAILPDILLLLFYVSRRNYDAGGI